MEKLTPEVFAEVKGDDKVMCANVDLYSGLVYKVLKIPEDLFAAVAEILASVMDAEKRRKLMESMAA